MEGSEDNKPWGKLRRLGAESEPDVLLCKREWTIGRKKACDLSFPGNKLVSGDHCKITVDGESGLVSLEDTSTNGTVINRLKVVKKQIYMLQNEDIIHVVYRKHEPEHDVAYIYKSLNRTPEIMQEYLDDTVESVFNVTKDTSIIEPADAEYPAPPSLPILRLSSEEPQPSTSTSNLFCASHTSVCELTSAGQPSSAALGPGCPADISLIDASGRLHADTAASGKALNMCDKKGSRMCSSSTTELEEDIQEPARKKMRGDDGLTSYKSSASSGENKGQQTIPEAPKDAELKPDKMEETLTCIICQELLHDCVSLQPCMHTFCAACYSGWMERSSLCPTCRCPVERICKNHILNNLVEAYLLQHPGTSRPTAPARGQAAEVQLVSRRPIQDLRETMRALRATLGRMDTARDLPTDAERNNLQELSQVSHGIEKLLAVQVATLASMEAEAASRREEARLAREEARATQESLWGIAQSIVTLATAAIAEGASNSTAGSHAPAPDCALSSTYHVPRMLCTRPGGRGQDPAPSAK